MDEFLRTVVMPKMAAMNKKGFTIVELLVSILLTSIIMGAIYSVYRVQTHSAKVQENRLEAQEYARSVLDIMVREIRNAGYNPLGAPTTTPPTALGTGCASGLNGTLVGAPGIVTADATTLTFTYDFQGTTAGTNPDGNCNGPDEQITYTLDPTGCPPNFTNVTRNGSPLTDCNVPTGAANFSLTYFAQNLSTAMSPIVLADIQRVSISLTVQSKNPDTEFGGQLTATVTSNADLRNRGLPS